MKKYHFIKMADSLLMDYPDFAGSIILLEIKEMDKAVILLIFYYISDELHELEHIAESIYVEGMPISSQHPIY